MFDAFFNYFYLSRNWYQAMTKQISLASTKIHDKNLAGELEKACENQEGILTYSQYHQIEQFGVNGYVSRSNKIGLTDVSSRWGEALAQYCIQNNYHHIIEFGCGNGELGVATVKAFKKLSSLQIVWRGIEINESLHEHIKKKFLDANLKNSFGGVVTRLDGLQKISRTLFVFPYCLDSIPPDIFINTQEEPSYPDAMIGMKIKNGILHEEIMSQQMLKAKGITLQNGFYTSEKQTFDLRTWKLRKGQRAYIPVNSFALFSHYVSFLSEDATCIVIDEFRNSPLPFSSGVLGSPKYLYKRKKRFNKEIYYKQAGKNYLYFPVYFETFYKFLHSLGFRSLTYEIEQIKAAELIGKRKVKIKKNYFTHVFIAKKKHAKELQVLPLIYFPKKFL
jgi:hypothetical protein